MTDESQYKREEDRQWRRSVEARLEQAEARIVSLTTAQKQTDDDKDKQDEKIDELEILCQGDPLKRDDNGLKGDVKELWVAVNELHAIMSPDNLGAGGVKKRLETLESMAGIKIESSRNRWKFGTVVVGATATAIAGIITALLAIDPVRKSVGHWVESHLTTTQKGKKAPAKKALRKPKRPTPPPPLEGIPDGQATGSQ